MGTQRKYEDFDLVIEPADDGGYRARVAESPAGEATASFDLPFSDLELENFLLKVGRPRRGTRRLESPEMEAARDFGGRLFKAVFNDDIRLCLRRSLDETERSGEGLRIRLRLNDAPGLVNVPWEYLYNESADRFLVLSSWTPIVRYPDLPQPIRPLAIAAPLRILAVISSPSDYETLDVAGEAERIRSSLADLERAGLVQVDTLEDATLLELQRKLRQTDYHVLHFIGHGGFDKAADDGVLVFEDGTGRSRTVSGRDLGTILADQRSLRLAVLNACDGARASAEDPFAGSAQSLIRQGLPAVVAMQFEITDGAAIAFAHEFYAAIADGSPVDAAVAEGRRAIFGMGNDIEWGTPVLYMRSPDGMLFDIKAAAAPAEDHEDEPQPIAAADGGDPPLAAESAAAATGQETRSSEPAELHEPVSTGEDSIPEHDSSPVEVAELPAESPSIEAPDSRGASESTFSTPTAAKPPWGKVGIGVAAAAIAGAIGFASLTGGGTEGTTTGAPTTTQPQQSTTTAAGTVTAPPGAATAVFLTAQPAIDGDASDWPQQIEHTTPERIFIHPDIQNGNVARGGSDATARILLGWDDAALYVFATVEDDVLSQPNTGNQIWRGDAVNLNIALGGPSDGPDADDFQITLAPADPVAGTPGGSLIFEGNGSRFSENRTDIAQVFQSSRSGSYTIEARIPWSAMNVSSVAAGEGMRILVSVFDNDGETAPSSDDSLQSTILANTPGAQFQRPQTWGTLTLER